MKFLEDHWLLLLGVVAAVVIFAELRSRGKTTAAVGGMSTANLYGIDLTKNPPRPASPGFYWYGPYYLLDDQGPHWMQVKYGDSPNIPGIVQ